MMITNGISGLRMVILLIAVIHCITGQRKWSSWSRYSQCSVTCGQGRQRRQRYCIKSSSSSSSSDTCAGPKEMYAPCQMLACPQEKILPCNCGCTMQKRFGLIVSQLPSRETKSCEWRILVKKGSKISLNVTKLVLKAGWVRVASGKKALLTLLKPGPEPKYPWRYLSDGNIMTLELLSYPDATGKYSTDTYLAAQYREITAQKKVRRPDQRKSPNNNNNNNNMRSNNNNNNTKSPNVTAIIGITACVVVIVLVAVFLAVRRHRKRNQSEAEEDGNEAVTLHSEYDPNGKPRVALNKEEKPLMDPTTECDRMSPPHGILMKPSALQGRESAYESDKGMHQTYNGNAMARLRYPPEYYINTPTYVHDPSFIRMLPVTTAGQAQQQVMQPIVLQSPRVDS